VASPPSTAVGSDPRGSSPAMVNRTAIRLVLVRDLVLPVVAYKVLAACGLTDVPALAIAALIPAGGLLYAWRKGRTVGIFGVLSIATLLLAMTAAFVTGDARVLFARASLVTGLLGIACMISMARPTGIRPLAFYVIRQFRGGGRIGGGMLESAWHQRRGFRTGTTVLTAIWGIACLVEASLRVVLASSLPVDVMAAASPALTLGFALVIVGSTVTFGRLMRRAPTRVAGRA
jgi:hypothetical protein